MTARLPGRLNYGDPRFTACPRGHDLKAPAAIYVDCYGRRLCLECRQTRDRERKRRLVAARKAGVPA